MILNDIANKTMHRVRFAKEKMPLNNIKYIAKSLDNNTGFPFEKALNGNDDIGFICEIKRASPSKGIIADDFNHIEIAKEYENAGADCISILTEPIYFKGSDRYIKEIRQEVKIPLLRKDFTIDEYQIYEAKVLGADAVLLICALLDTEKIRKYIKICDLLGLSALVEAHDENEIQSALEAGARMLGVNNRNLKDFTEDINNSLKLRSLVPDDIIFVSESGIKNKSDIQSLKNYHVDAVLIGEALIKSKNKKMLLEELKGDKND